MKELVTCDAARENAWKYTSGPKPDDLKGNRYLNPQNTEPTSHPIDSSHLKASNNYLEIGPITCYDSTGRPFEHYDRIEIARDFLIETTPSSQSKVVYKNMNFSYIDAIVRIERDGMFLPSFALMCNALVWLYDHKDNAAAKTILAEYNGYSIITPRTHVLNTLIYPEKDIVCHYPESISRDVNKCPPKTNLPFTVGCAQEIPFLEAIQLTNYKVSLQNLTGLKDLERLYDVAQQLLKEVYFNPPRTEDHILPMLEIGEDFHLDCEREKKASGAARGFRLVVGDSK